MITSAKITNFRCIREVELKLGPLTVLVGPNGSGKSSIIDALDPSHSRGGVTTWRRKRGQTRIHVSTGRGDASWVNQDYPQTSYRMQILQLQPSMLRAENRVQREGTLNRTGGNLANVFATLTRKQQESLSARLRTLVPVIGDVDVQPTVEGQHQLRFQDRWDAEVWYQPSEVSDGTMLVTAFLVLQYQPDPIDIVAIEDAEHALHPYLLSELVKLLRALSKGELGPRAIQVLCSTHSAELLDYLDPSEVRFISRDTEGALTVESIDTETTDWERAYDEYKHSLADVWLSGGAGGV